MNEFDPKDPEEIVPLTFDFAALTDTPSNPVVSLAHHKGTIDPNVGAMLIGSPLVVGAQVRIKVQNGLNGSTYRLRCKVESPEGNKWVLAGYLPVVAE